MPDTLQKLNDQFKDQAVKIILVDVGEEKEKVTPYLRQENINLPSSIDLFYFIAKDNIGYKEVKNSLQNSELSSWLQYIKLLVVHVRPLFLFLPVPN